jgi:vitamin B12 transporter
VEVALSEALTLDLRGWYAAGRSEVDGYPAPLFLFGDTAQVSKNRQWVGYAGANLATGRLKHRFAFTHTDVRRRSFDPGASPAERSDYRGRNEWLEYQGLLDLDAVQASFGAERETQRFAKKEVFDPAGHRGEARTDSAYALLTARPMAGLDVSGGLRFDDHSGFGGHGSLSLAAAWSPNGGATTLRASHADGFKAPSLYQLASEYGNPALAPETAKGWDAGVTQRLWGGLAEVGATWFRRSTRNLIDFAYCPGNPVCADGRFGYYKNVSRAFAQGLEAVVRIAPADGVRIEASYSHVRSEDRSAGSTDFGKQLVRRPKDSLSVVADYLWASGLQTGATLRWTGARRDVDYDAWPAQDVRLGGYVLADVRAAFPVAAGIELYGRIENLFDARYETVLRYGVQGRAAYAGVRLSY